MIENPFDSIKKNVKPRVYTSELTFVFPVVSGMRLIFHITFKNKLCEKKSVMFYIKPVTGGIYRMLCKFKTKDRFTVNTSVANG